MSGKNAPVGRAIARRAKQKICWVPKEIPSKEYVLNLLKTIGHRALEWNRKIEGKARQRKGV